MFGRYTLRFHVHASCKIKAPDPRVNTFEGMKRLQGSKNASISPAVMVDIVTLNGSPEAKSKLNGAKRAVRRYWESEKLRPQSQDVWWNEARTTRRVSFNQIDIRNVSEGPNI